MADLVPVYGRIGFVHLPPPAPPVLTLVSFAGGVATLSWTAVANATGYGVFMGTALGEENLLSAVTTTTTALTAAVSGLGVGPYYFVVKALGTGGYGQPSNEVATVPLVVATPTLSPVGGTYATPQTVTISCSTSGATIYYTTDGSTPTTSSAVYTGPLTVSVTTTVKAIAAKTGYNNSSVATSTYTFAAYAQAVLLDTPVDFWRMSATVTPQPSLGSFGTNLAFNGAPIVSQPALIVDPNTSMSMNNGNCGLEVSSGALVTTTFTLASWEAWIKPQSLAADSEIITTYNFTGGGGVEFTLRSTGHLTLALSAGSTFATSTATLTPGNTYHVVATMDAGTGLWKLYINGVLDSSGTGSWIINLAGSNFTIGYFPGFGGIENFLGFIDEVAIYDYILSPTQIANHFAIGTA